MDNLKFDEAGVDEVRRKFFGTLYNTYSFFALYANVDGFTGKEPEVPMEERQEIDRWIISYMNTLIKGVKESYENYDVTAAGRMIQDFVCDHLSNWYVRLNRKRFWGGVMDSDKLAAYQTLYSCLENVAVLAAPIAPFYMERLFLDLNAVSQRHPESSVHMVLMPEYDGGTDRQESGEENGTRPVEFVHGSGFEEKSKHKGETASCQNCHPRIGQQSSAAFRQGQKTCPQ